MVKEHFTDTLMVKSVLKVNLLWVYLRATVQRSTQRMKDMKGTTRMVNTKGMESMNSKVVPDMKENTRMASKMVRVLISTKMEMKFLVLIRLAYLMDNLFILTVMEKSLKECTTRTDKLASVNTTTSMERNMKVTI